MTVLYICEPGAVLRRDGESWVVTAAPERGARDVLARILGHQLQAAILLGRVHATTEALHLCLAQTIMLAWLDRGGRFLGRLTPRQNRSAEPRLAQYRLALDPARRSAPPGGGPVRSAPVQSCHDAAGGGGGLHLAHTSSSPSGGVPGR